MIRVRQERIDDAAFARMRREVLSAWPTGREVDLDEAAEYQRKMPEGKNFTKVLAGYRASGTIGLFPRSGVPVVEEEIRLLRAMNGAGVRLFPFTTDSYTRNLQLEKAQKGLEESIRTGKAKLNGYPIINHGVSVTRRVVESCDGAFDPRSSRVANSFVGEIAFASGMTAMPNSFFGWIGGYDKTATPEECIETAQYLGRLIGCYADRGVVISTDTHGWLPNGVVPMYVNMATQIIEALVSACQGVRSVVPLTNFQGNIAQDIADIRVSERLFRKYLDRFGFHDTLIPGVIGNQSSLFPFPQDIGRAFGYINYTAMVAAMTPLAACSVKTVDEALGVPSIESHVQTYRSAHWIFNMMRQQQFEPDSPAIRQEERMAELAVTAILDRVIEMGDGDVAVGTVRAIEAGVLDSPFSINIYPKDQVLGARDLRGACRYIKYGNLPIPEEVREYNDQKMRERELAEGSRLDMKTSVADFWALAEGAVHGTVNRAEAEPQTLALSRRPVVVTGTVGVDSHVIGTKFLSCVLREHGIRVIALGAQTPPEEFIQAAAKNGADAIMITSLYGMARMDLEGFREQCTEAGIGGILLYIGGILGIGARNFRDDEAAFRRLGFDRVYPPQSDPVLSVRDLVADLEAGGRL
ncbi:MAG: methylaspartate mutase subunit S [Acidobacteria bacterium]|nr:methylaspartate mutase subunit S [Acidobacteriota bacterium]